MAYGKIKMGEAKPRPNGLDDLRNRSKKPPKPGTRPVPLTPRTPGKVRPDMGYGPGNKPKPPKPPKPTIYRPTTPKPMPPKARGGR